MEKKSLGRGLDSLVYPTTQETPSKEKLQILKIDQIDVSKFQPRQQFSDQAIEELAQSIKEKGIIQPILVRAIQGDRYELIAGERRLRASKQLELKEIPAIIRKIEDVELLELSIIENVQREELNVLEQAKAYQRLVSEFGYSQDQVASKVGKDKSSISNLLRLLNLQEKIQDYLSQGLISFGHARALVGLSDQALQLELCLKIIDQGLSVRQLEALINPKDRAQSEPPKRKDPDTIALENKLQETLGTKVRLKHGRKRGKIVIEYYSLDDLGRLLKIFGVKID